MNDSREYMMKIQQLTNTAVNLWMSSPHELTQQESVYLNAASGGLENVIPLLMASTRDKPIPPEPTTEG